MRLAGLTRMQAAQHGRVEVVGTCHFSSAVRRLAKAVVLGLKAQQVRGARRAVLTVAEQGRRLHGDLRQEHGLMPRVCYG